MKGMLVRPSIFDDGSVSMVLSSDRLCRMCMPCARLWDMGYVIYRVSTV
jgi:hypothetical protein